MVFADRTDAGRALADLFEQSALSLGPSGLVLGAARGGVIVAAEVARRLELPLALALASKIGAPGQPELAVGALGEGASIINDELVRRLGLGERQLDAIVARAREELDRRALVYRRGGRPPDVAGRNVAVVDDGVATGATLVAIARSVRAGGASRIVIGVPVGPPSSLAMLEREADQVLSVERPAHLMAVGQWYRDFEQVSDEQMLEALDAVS